jgi:ABC-type maltose transport system permease subunit
MAASDRVVEPKVKLPPRRWLREIGWRHLILILAVLFSLFPIMYVLGASINTVDNLSESGLNPIPANTTWDNFREVIKGEVSIPGQTDVIRAPFLTWLGNTWKVALIASFFNLFLASLAAFAFSRLRFRGRRVGLLTLLLVQVFPTFLTFIALFLILQQLGDVLPSIGLNTHPGLILVYLGGAIGFNAFLIKGFMDSIPASLDESAVVDGASQWQVFWRIVLPLTRPVLAVIFIITFINLYAEFILANTLLTSTDQYTYAVGLRLFVQSQYAAKWGLLAAAAFIGAFPVVVLILVLQKQIIGGLVQGAVKG